MSVRIVLCSNPVQLTAALARDHDGELLLDPEGRPKLVLLHRGTSLSDHDDELEIFLESPDPVTVVLRDLDDVQGPWTLNATPQGNAGNPSDTSTPREGSDGSDASTEIIPWDRGEGLCCTRWSETPWSMPVTVTATNATGTAVHKPIFIKVQPVGVKPWP